MSASHWMTVPILSALAVACGGSYGTPTPVPPPQQAAELSVSVAGAEWRRVQSFESSGPDDPHYVVSGDADGGATVIFGDGIRGRRPPAGAPVRVSYRYGGGGQGNVTVDVERVVGAPPAALCLVLRADDLRLQFRPCEAERGR